MKQGFRFWTVTDIPILALFDMYTGVLVYRLKSVEAIKMKFVAPMPEQISTTTIHFLKVSGKLC